MVFTIIIIYYQYTINGMNISTKQTVLMMDVYGRIQTEETCCNYTCRHGLSLHIGRYHGKCKCKTFKTSGAKNKK